ncbi:MAG: hypothetical protein AB7F28_03360 [Candidatus Margulisiibacteriota bacterium]
MSNPKKQPLYAIKIEGIRARIHEELGQVNLAEWDQTLKQSAHWNTAVKGSLLASKPSTTTGDRSGFPADLAQ